MVIHGYPLQCSAKQSIGTFPRSLQKSFRKASKKSKVCEKTSENVKLEINHKKPTNQLIKSQENPQNYSHKIAKSKNLISNYD
jgi:hypothetical protein